MTQPNILLLHCHDLGRFLSAYGIDSVQSPALDSLAREGVVFERAFATAPQCSPARSSLFTGDYPQQTGVLGLTHDPHGWDMIDPSRHVATQLRGAGYATELVGIHHESRTLPDDEVAERLGFDRVETGGYAPEVARRAADAVRRRADGNRPFYLQVGFIEPHRLQSDRDEAGGVGFLGPHIQPDQERGVTVPPYLEDTASSRAEIAELQGAVRTVDAAVGEVLQALENAGVADRTLVVFTTDHGIAMPRAKCSLYEAGLEVALIVRVPWRRDLAGRRVSAMVSHLSVVPTLLDAAGDAESDRTAPNLIAVSDDLEPGQSEVFGQMTYHNYYDPKRSVRDERHKLIVNYSNAPLAMDPTQSWAHRSLPLGLDRGNMPNNLERELYDLDTDPLELTNLAADPAHADVLDRLQTDLHSWMRRVDDPLLRGFIPAPRTRATVPGAVPARS